MKKLRIKDNSLTPKADFTEISVLTRRISDITLEQLEREGVFVFPELIKNSEDLTKEQMILQSINDNYHTGNVMGFIGYGNERLIITSRFASAEHDYFFQYMLERVLDFPNIIDLETDVKREEKLFRFLLFLFPFYLKKALRKGLFKTYRRKQYNDSNVKGVIDISRHITKNTPFIGKIAYNQREYSYDNAITELIRHTIEYIKSMPYGNRLLASVKEEVNIIVDATNNYELYDRRKVISDNIHNTIRHAYYREYRALQHLCLLILKNHEHNIASGSRQIYGILFDGAWLWEEYINNLIGDSFYHPMNKSGKGVQKLFACNIGSIYPDFISRNNQQRIIADAKYKPAKNISGDDYLQILAYLLRFEAQKGCFIFPEIEKTDNNTLWLNRGVTYEKNVNARNDISVIKLGLKIPASAYNYGDFKAQIMAEENELVAHIKNKNINFS